MTLKKLEDITKIEELIEFIKRFYPGLTVDTFTIEEIERLLFHTYIKLIGRITVNSPRTMRLFLRNYLMKYEIMNIKNVILGTILGMDIKEKSKMVNKLVEKYLNNTDFINGLLEITSLDQIQLYLKNTIYNKAVREGILYFRNTNEIFVLEAFLDRLYYKVLGDIVKFLSPKEKIMISVYVKYKSEIYNLNIIYRGIKNNVDRNLLSQFLISNFIFLNQEILNHLLSLTNIDEFITLLSEFLTKKKEIRINIIRFPLKGEHLIWEIERLYLDYFFKKFHIKIDDIEYQSIFRIMEILIRKENEIKIHVLPKVVEIIHEKYKVLS
ncbi:MAG: V0D/AC39 family V-type ATPase subunit [Promethearchaeota archaeon]